MSIETHIEQVKERLREGTFTSEAAVSQGILLPALNKLGWPVFDTTVVVPEYSLEGRRVDFALCHPASKPVVFIEVKKVGLTEGADKQLFEYAFHLGVPMAILTDGQEWSIYLPAEQGLYNERRVYKLDLLERSTEEAGKRLDRYLNYKRVCSGDALSAARLDYKSISRNREITATFPKAWAALLDEQDSLLLDLLAEKVEELCGYKPDLDVCSQYLEGVVGGNITSEMTKPRQKTSTQPPLSPSTNTIRRRPIDQFSFQFKGKSYDAGSAREVMIRVFQLLAKEDSGFLERFAARKHGKKRRYLARNKMELYPGRPDLVEEHSVEVLTGWWMGTNYSRRDIQKILDLGLEVVESGVRSMLKARVV